MVASGNVQIIPAKVAGSDEIKWMLFVSINPGGPNGEVQPNIL